MKNERMIRKVVKFVGAVHVLVLIAKLDTVIISESEPDAGEQSVLIHAALRSIVHRIEVEKELVGCGEIEQLRQLQVAFNHVPQSVSRSAEVLEIALF